MINRISPELIGLEYVTFCHYQRVSIASYASAGIARAEMSVCPSVCPSVRHTPVLYQNKESYRHDFLTAESMNILVSRNIWIVTKFERGHTPSEGDL